MLRVLLLFVVLSKHRLILFVNGGGFLSACIVTDCLHINVNSDVNVTFLTEPIFLMSSDGPESVSVKGKNAVKFEERGELKCSADSVPPSVFSWKINGTPMNASQADIIIDKAKVTDSGIYTCEAFNPITGMTKSTKHNLAVTGKRGSSRIRSHSRFTKHQIHIMAF